MGNAGLDLLNLQQLQMDNLTNGYMSMMNMPPINQMLYPQQPLGGMGVNHFPGGPSGTGASHNSAASFH